MLIITKRPCVVRGRDMRADAVCDVTPEEAAPLIQAGDAAPWAPPARAAAPNPYAPAAAPAAAEQE